VIIIVAGNYEQLHFGRYKRIYCNYEQLHFAYIPYYSYRNYEAVSQLIHATKKKSLPPIAKTRPRSNPLLLYISTLPPSRPSDRARSGCGSLSQCNAQGQLLHYYIHGSAKQDPRRQRREEEGAEEKQVEESKTDMTREKNPIAAPAAQVEKKPIEPIIRAAQQEINISSILIRLGDQCIHCSIDIYRSYRPRSRLCVLLAILRDLYACAAYLILRR
jgi:hypothetical protein